MAPHCKSWFIKSWLGRYTFFERNIKVEKKENLGYTCWWKFHQLELSRFCGLTVPAYRSITFAASNHSTGFWMSHNCLSEFSTIVPQIGHVIVSFTVQIYSSLHKINAHWGFVEGWRRPERKGKRGRKDNSQFRFPFTIINPLLTFSFYLKLYKRN